METHPISPDPEGRREAPEHGSPLQDQLLAATRDVLIAIGGDGYITHANAAASAVFGLPVSQVCGKNMLEIVTADERKRCRKAMDNWLAGSQRDALVFECHLAHADGSTRNALWRLTPASESASGAQYVACARDITALREAERQASEREVRMVSLVAGMLDAVITIDLNGIIQFASDSAVNFFGYTPEEMVGENIKIIMPEPYRSEHDDYLERYRETGESWILNTTREFQAVRKSGARFWIELSVSRIDMPGQAEPLICGTIRDSTARRHAEDALKDSENRLRAIFDQEFQLVGLLDPSGRVLEVNRTAVKRARTSRHELLGLPFWETPWWNMDSSLQIRLKGWIRRAARGEFIREETTHVDEGGNERVVDFSLKPILNEQGDVILLLPEGRDITELKRAQTRETQMLKALAAIGESSSLLAHEIKNPITSINLALRSMVNKLGVDERSVLEDLVTRMQRLEHTMRRTLSFAKPLELDAKCHDVLPLVLEAVDSMQPDAEGRGVEIEVKVDQACPPVRVDSGLIEEALCNLVANSLQAVDEGGAIELSALSLSSDWVEVVVQDDGPGIPQSLLPTLFRPFVTTKEDGTGLGLALVKKIAEEHGGRVDVETHGPLGGACFRIKLPIHK